MTRTTSATTVERRNPETVADREPGIIEAFRAISDVLPGDAHDVTSVLAVRAAELLEASAAAVILVEHDRLAVAAATDERARLLEEYAVVVGCGPGVRCARTGEPAGGDDLSGDPTHGSWPRFAAGAQEAGFRAEHALPLRRREQVVGALCLLHATPRTLDAPDARLARALAETAAAGLLQQRALRRSETTTAQLQGALDSRVVIEQAKGVLATQCRLASPDHAFGVLRRHARHHGLRLTDLARGVVEHTVDLTDGVAPRGRRRPDR